MNEIPAQQLAPTDAPPPSGLPGDCLALSTGIFPKHPPTPSNVARAEKIVARAESAIKAFFNAESPDPYLPERAPPQDELHQSLAEPLDTDGWQVEHIPNPVIYPQWILTVTAARQYAADKWPIFEEDTLEPANFELAPDELGDVWEIVRAIDGQDGFFGDLKSHTLSPEQVDAVKTCYPDYYAALMEIVFEQLQVLVKRKNPLRYELQDMVRVLQQLPDEATIQIEKPKAPEKSEPENTAQKTAASARTPGEAREAIQQQKGM